MAKTIYVLNGPNMNMLGIREPHLYGKTTLKDVEALCARACKERGYEMDFRQSNHEGDLIDWLHEAHAKKVSGVVINPGGHTSTSISLLDAVKSIGPLPVIEVHISHVHQREEWRQWSYIGHGVKASLCGFGVNGYVLAISGLVSMLEDVKD